MVADRARYADPARFGDPFQSCRDIHPVAMDVVALDDDVAEVDADPEYDPLFFRGRHVAFGHSPLHRDRAGDGLNHARELDEDAVAGRLDDAALVLGDLRIDEFTAMASEPREGAGFVLPHEAAIAGHIGGENGREPAFDPLSAQMFPPRRRPVANSSRPAIHDPSVCSPGGSRATALSLAGRRIRHGGNLGIRPRAQQTRKASFA